MALPITPAPAPVFGRATLIFAPSSRAKRVPAWAGFSSPVPAPTAVVPRLTTSQGRRPAGGPGH